MITQMDSLAHDSTSICSVPLFILTSQFSLESSQFTQAKGKPEVKVNLLMGTAYRYYNENNQCLLIMTALGYPVGRCNRGSTTYFHLEFWHVNGCHKGT